MKNRKYIMVVFDDETAMLNTVSKLRESGEVIADVLSPFPVHGLDDVLAIKRSKIPVGGFILGAIGTISAFGFQSWVLTKSYPLIIGGKPLLAAPAFIPITFEVTVLFGGLAMAIAFFVRSKLKPDIRFEPPDPRITDDKFVVFIDPGEGDREGRIRELLNGSGASEISYNDQKNSD